MRIPAMALLTFSSIMISACSSDTPDYPSAEGKPYPYILKEGCSYSIVEELSRSTIDSPRASGMPDSAVSATISLGDMSITVSDCKVIANPYNLPIYED